MSFPFTTLRRGRKSDFSTSAGFPVATLVARLSKVTLATEGGLPLRVLYGHWLN